jgi:acetylornithine deacetylase/succinyl-diaminopimelate desuccinylase-like protein
VLDSVRLTGSGSLVDRLWTRPSVAVLGIDAPSVAEASNTLVPVARAKISLRVAPGDDAIKASAALKDHLEANAPWGAQVTVTEGQTGQPCSVNARGAGYEAARSAFRTAWGVDPIDMGMGGSIPFIAEFQQTFPQASILVTGVEDPDTRAHGIDEGLHLAEFRKVCLAEALLLQNLADGS